MPGDIATAVRDVVAGAVRDLEAGHHGHEIGDPEIGERLDASGEVSRDRSLPRGDDGVGAVDAERRTSEGEDVTPWIGRAAGAGALAVQELEERERERDAAHAS